MKLLVVFAALFALAFGRQRQQVVQPESVYSKELLRMCEKLTALERCYLGTFHNQDYKFSPQSKYWVSKFKPYLDFSHLQRYNELGTLRRILLEVLDRFHPSDKSKPGYEDNQRVIELKVQLKTANELHVKVLGFGKALDTFTDDYMSAHRSWFFKHSIAAHLGDVQVFEFPNVVVTATERERWDEVYVLLDHFTNSIKTGDQMIAKLKKTSEFTVNQALSVVKVRQESLQKATKSLVTYLNDEIALVRSLIPDYNRQQFRNALVEHLITRR